MPVDPASFIEDLKRYIGFSAEDANRLRSLAPLVEPHLPALADRFYEEIPHHPGAERVFTGGATQVARLKLTLEQWARGLFSGVYDETYVNERFRIGFRHVQIGLPQRYVISAMYVVDQFLRDVFDGEIADDEERRQAHRSLSRVLNLDLNLICETYFEGSLRDLRHLNEELASTNRSLEEANRVKGEFLATVSHELRTPLTAIIGFSKLLADDAVPQPEKRREFTRDIHSSALALLSLVDEILDVARLESGRFQMRMGQVDLLPEIREAVTEVALEAERKHLTLDTDLPPTLPAILGDSGRVRQVLVNLLGNAVKFTERGSVRLTAKVEVNERVSVSVRDTGIGIAPEAIPLLFDKFRQLDASHTRRQSGVGLGLVISKALMERMGGAVELRSEGPGKGTVVTVSFAAASGDQKTVPSEAEQSTRVALVIGADAGTRQQIADALGEAGYLVRQAATEDGVRGLAATGRIDAVIVDVTNDIGRSMLTSWLDGLIELQRGGSGANVVLLANGGLDAASRVQLDVLARSSHVVARPVDPEELVRTLDQVAGRGRSRPMRILVVDDDPLVFSFLTQTLPADRYSLLYATTGHEGLRMAAQHPCDAMLLDLRMPDGSGYDVIRALKLGPSPSPLPIIVLTNYPEPTNTEERQLLQSHIVFEVLPKTSVAQDPKALIDRLNSVRSGAWPA